MMDVAALLAAYDKQLRIAAETPGAISVTPHGPLQLITFAGGRGLVTYRDLGDTDRSTIGHLVEDALKDYEADRQIRTVEWKTRGHDRAAGLHEALVSSSFVPQESESIMLGEVQLLAATVSLLREVTLRKATTESDVHAMCAMQAEVFGDPFSADLANSLLRRLSCDDGMQLWIAEVAGQIVSAGRLEPVADTDFAGIWGGATRPQWRHRGIYRALTAARARAAIGLGKTLINSDSTEYSRPILERSGFIKASTTTPYVWKRDGPAAGLLG